MARWARITFIAAISLSYLAALVFGSQNPNVNNEKLSATRTASVHDEIHIEFPETSTVSIESEDYVDHLWSDDIEDETETTDEFETHSLPLESPHLPLVNKTKKSTILLVSTLDGTLSALNAEEGGNLLWKVDTGPGSLLSSSISKVELYSRGKLVRLIPSLDGGLYKFDEEAIEPIPISAESLLHSSYQTADDLLISGGKEVRTYGIDAHTGHLQYACSVEGCNAQPPSALTSGEFLILRRHNQVVRAIEPRTGTERWNFSVGRHEASLLHTTAESFAECRENPIKNPEEQMDCIINESLENLTTGPPTASPIIMEFKVVVPDGVVCAVHPHRPGQVLWKKKFESPVVHAWQLIDGKLIPLDLFGAEFIPALEDQPWTNDPTNLVPSPLLYVGIHNQQLYVQESRRLINMVNEVSKPLASSVQPLPENSVGPCRIRWKPVPATSLAVIQGKPSRSTVIEEGSDEPQNLSIEYDPISTALIVRHQTDYPFDRGFYLFDESGDKVAIKGSNETISEGEEDEEELWEGGKDNTVHIVIVSLWFWWREVAFISFSTAVFFHLVFTRKFVEMLQIRQQYNIRVLVPHVYQLAMEHLRKEQRDQANLANLHPAIEASPAEPAAMESVVVVEPVESAPPAPAPPTPPTPDYVSRYLTDFEPIQCLGRGGFGLVFEVRNRLDDCHYAVKRIQLPNSQEAREKVMREVKALAKLDNSHIVRYFHAWIECPPPGWQEVQDAAWVDCESLNGPTPFNSGDDDDFSVSKSKRLSSSSSSDSDDDVDVAKFRLSNVIKSLDRFSTKNRSLTSDSSFDVVFEHSNHASNQSASVKKDDSSLMIGDSSNELENSDRADSCDWIHPGSAASQSSIPVEKRCTKHDAKMFLYIQMQLCRKESLREWLRAHVSHRDPLQIMQMFNEMVLAVEYVHLQGLIHRDLKPSNIFFAPDGAIKIGDFGLVTAMAEEAYLHSPCHELAGGILPFRRHTDQVGTQLYMSPEQIEGKPYNHKVDIYSLGLIFFELLWPLSTQMEQVTVISQLRKLKFPDGFSEQYPEEKILLCKMLSPNPDGRPTTIGIRASPPLSNQQDPSISEVPAYLHFNLQRPRSSSSRSTTRTSSSSSS